MTMRCGCLSSEIEERVQGKAPSWIWAYLVGRYFLYVTSKKSNLLTDGGREQSRTIDVHGRCANQTIHGNK